MTIDVTKLINYQMNQSMQTVEKNTWQGVITVKLNKKKEQLKYFQQIAEWEDEYSSSNPSRGRRVSKIKS